MHYEVNLRKVLDGRAAGKSSGTQAADCETLRPPIPLSVYEYNEDGDRVDRSKPLIAARIHSPKIQPLSDKPTVARCIRLRIRQSLMQSTGSKLAKLDMTPETWPITSLHSYLQLDLIYEVGSTEAAPSA